MVSHEFVTHICDTYIQCVCQSCIAAMLDMHLSNHTHCPCPYVSMNICIYIYIYIFVDTYVHAQCVSLLERTTSMAAIHDRHTHCCHIYVSRTHVIPYEFQTHMYVQHAYGCASRNAYEPWRTYISCMYTCHYSTCLHIYISTYDKTSYFINTCDTYM